MTPDFGQIRARVLVAPDASRAIRALCDEHGLGVAPETGLPRPVPGSGPAPARGLTVTGEVANYVPVTDEMLRNPPPGDWLMARRNSQAWSHGPLTEITRANVKDLKLAWVWAMNEVGANQPMPLIAVLAVAASRLIDSRLYGVSPQDPITLAGATGLLLAVALGAAFLPARRGARMDPMAALRQQ
jgi:hypothetical protein